jgi:SAM-dependent methyltransferase
LDIAARWLEAPGEELAGTSGAGPANGAGPLTVTPGESSAARGPFWALASASSVPWPDEAFGAVALGEVLEHVENEREVVAEAVRVLRPGGVLVISVPAGPARMSASDVRAGHVRRYDRLGLRALLAGSGLDVELIRGWGWPVGRLYERLAYRASHGRNVRWAARSRALVVLEWLFGLESRWDSGDHGAGLIAVARRPMN